MKATLRSLAALGATLALTAVATAATCSTLTITVTPDPTGFINDIAIDLTGAHADTLAVLAFGEELGTTTIVTPLASLDLGLASPFSVLPLGMTDGLGDVAMAATAPAGIGLDLHAQAVTAGITMGPLFPTFDFCVSNVVDFSL
jgi:hypothetical protein